MIKLYNLISKKDGVYHSPYGCRILFSLKHKGLNFEHIGLEYTEIKKIIPQLTDGKWDKVPVVVYDDSSIVYDSENIAQDLDKRYPDKPLFPNGNHLSTFLSNFMSASALPVRKLIIMDLYNNLGDEENKKYFRNKYEAVLNMTLEQFSDNNEALFKQIEQTLIPIRTTLASKPFLENDQVTYSDYLLFSHFNLIKLISPKVFGKIITDHKDTTILNWYQSIKNLYKDLEHVLG